MSKYQEEHSIAIGMQIDDLLKRIDAILAQAHKDAENPCTECASGWNLALLPQGKCNACGRQLAVVLPG